MAQRLGVLGGTFDPPHVGHIAAAAEVRHALSLDAVLLVVAGEPWQKVATRRVTAAADRLAMVEAAVVDVEGVEASDLEIERGGPSFMVDTLRTLSGGGGGPELFLVLGHDAAAGLESWRDPAVVRSLATPVVVGRPHSSQPLPDGWPWIMVDVAALDVSSSEVRERVAAGRPIDGLVPSGTAAVLRARRLYRGHS